MKPGSYRVWTVALVILALAVIAGGLGAWWWGSAGHVSTDDARVKAEIVAISAETPGRIREITKREGDSVSSGEVLVRLDDREVRFQMEQARAEVDRARSKLVQTRREMNLIFERQKGETSRAEASLRSYRHHLEDARAHAKKAEGDWQRNQELFARQLISAQELSHAETELLQGRARLAAFEEKINEGAATLDLVRIQGQEATIKEADLQAQEAEAREAEAKLKELEHRLKLTTISSPVRGVVAKKNVHPGETVQAGQPLLMVVDATRYWVEANVEETEIRFIKPGNKALVRVDAYPGREFKGEVFEVGEATVSEFSLFSPTKLTGIFIKSTQRLPVKIAVDNPQSLLKVGMLAVVWIEKGKS